jgi:hypothetical protein
MKPAADQSKPEGERGFAFVGAAPYSRDRDLVERVMAFDHAWFAALPADPAASSWYIRSHIPGEFLPSLSDAAVWADQPVTPEGYTAVRLVRVQQVSPGHRTRRPFLILEESGPDLSWGARPG